jgi:ADP-ribose pyrophosphatase
MITVIDRNTVFRGDLIEVQAVSVKLSDGSLQSRELIVRPDTIGIIPICDDGRLLFIEEYALGAGKAVLTLPGGKVEDAGGSLSDQAQRELREETGYRSRAMERLMSLNSDPVGYLSRKIHVFVASGLEVDPLPADIGEEINLVPLTIEEAVSALQIDFNSHPEVIAAVLLYLVRMKYFRSP